MTESTVYVLGAGASAEAGVPLTKKLLKLLDRRSGDSELSRFIKRFGFKNAKERSIQDLINFVNSCVRDNQPVSFPVKRTVRKETGRPLNASAET